jgi:hypothetical protein
MIEIGHWMGAIFVARKPNGDGRDEKLITNTEAIWEFEGKNSTISLCSNSANIFMINHYVPKCIL